MMFIERVKLPYFYEQTFALGNNKKSLMIIKDFSVNYK